MLHTQDNLHHHHSDWFTIWWCHVDITIRIFPILNLTRGLGRKRKLSASQHSQGQQKSAGVWHLFNVVWKDMSFIQFEYLFNLNVQNILDMHTYNIHFYRKIQYKLRALLKQNMSFCTSPEKKLLHIRLYACMFMFVCVYIYI